MDGTAAAASVAGVHYPADAIIFSAYPGGGE